jgi:hypothetical protein
MARSVVEVVRSKSANSTVDHKLNISRDKMKVTVNLNG